MLPISTSLFPRKKRSETPQTIIAKIAAKSHKIAETKMLYFKPMVKEKKTTVKELKNKFRQTKAWKEFRSEMKEYCQGIDFITQSKLLRGANLHHKVLLKSSKNVE